LGVPHGWLTGLPNGQPDPDGVFTLRTHKLRPGWASSVARGRWCSVQAATIVDLHPGVAGSSTGASVSGPVKNWCAGNISRAGAGAYCFSGLSLTPNNAAATLDSSFTTGFVTASTTPFGPRLVGIQAEVKTFDVGGAPADRSFGVIVN
jgi:hypothetical protein